MTPKLSLAALSGVLVGLSASALSQSLPMTEGKFQPSLESLRQYKYPQWFRDAKFGIWAHWGPQSVPMDGDWYARGMYEQGSGHNRYHLAHYGHPSVFGYKDIIPLWHAEKWDPARLMTLYKKAGAKYFVSMGSHHDNFFLWNSKLHRWNAVNMGPHRDVVGTWQREAKKNGLRFGVSEHLGASFTWFQASHGADKTGEKAGVPYDGADPRYADLYHEAAAPDDTGWYSKNPKWQREWYSEIKELVDNYHPDLLYSDGALPFGNEVGMSLVAHFYNSNAAQHGGETEAIYNCKQPSNGRWVEDLERGVMGRINPYPWQTDTSIGDWFYNRNWKYRPINWVVDTLVDVVSKNGNLLLNVVQRPDGTIDPEVEGMLGQMADWTAIHKEAIYGSRPWLVYGEGPVSAHGGSFSEEFGYTARDIRFTTKGSTLYALSLAYPTDGQVLIRSLAKTDDPTQNVISRIRLLGYNGKVTWTQDREGLHVTVPASGPSPITAGLRIEGQNLKPVTVPKVVVKVKPDASDVLNLTADLADLDEGPHLETRDGKPNIGFWSDASAGASWTLEMPNPGKYEVTAEVASENPSTKLVAEVGSEKWTSDVPTTGDWGRFQTIPLGTVTLTKGGDVVFKVHPESEATWKPINLRSIKLTPVR